MQAWLLDPSASASAAVAVKVDVTVHLEVHGDVAVVRASVWQAVAEKAAEDRFAAGSWEERTIASAAPYASAYEAVGGDDIDEWTC